MASIQRGAGQSFIIPMICSSEHPRFTFHPIFGRIINTTLAPIQGTGSHTAHDLTRSPVGCRGRNEGNGRAGRIALNLALILGPEHLPLPKSGRSKEMSREQRHIYNGLSYVPDK